MYGRRGRKYRYLPFIAYCFVFVLYLRTVFVNDPALSSAAIFDSLRWWLLLRLACLLGDKGSHRRKHRCQEYKKDFH